MPNVANKNFDVGDKSMESNKAGPKSVGLNTPMGSSPILNTKNFDDGGESNDRPPLMMQSDDDDSSDDEDENNDGKPPPIARRRSTRLYHPENVPIKWDSSRAY